MLVEKKKKNKDNKTKHINKNISFSFLSFEVVNESSGTSSPDHISKYPQGSMSPNFFFVNFLGSN